MNNWQSFAEAWCVDFEFGGDVGRPDIRCLVAREIHSGRLLRYWIDDLHGMRRAPFDCGPGAVIFAHYSTAELGCFLELGWPLPVNLVDTYVEFRRRFNGLKGVHQADGAEIAGFSLLDLAAWARLPGVSSAIEKSAMRDLALRGGSYPDLERQALLDYCQTDSDTLAAAVPRLLDLVDLTIPLRVDRHYLVAAAQMERRGVPVDTELAPRFRDALPEIKQRIPAVVDPGRVVFREDGSFSRVGFERFCQSHGIPVLLGEDGKTSLERDDLRVMARTWPREIGPIYQARHLLSEMRFEDLAIGRDGRNRCLLSIYRTITGRNAPSNTRFIFGPARWARSLIRPDPGWAIAYLDWSAQEFAIAAGLSGDPAMISDYAAGDPYLAGAVRAGLAPAGATRSTHAGIRSQFKVVTLACLYGMGAEGLAIQLDTIPRAGRDLLRRHRETYPVFWQWSDGAGRALFGSGGLWTPYEWRVRSHDGMKTTTGMNWPVQAAGAEMLRLAAALGVHNGVRICAPVHDAFLIEAPVGEIERDARRMCECMELASRKVLGGVTVRTPFDPSFDVVRYPGRFRDERDDETRGGAGMWPKMLRLLPGEQG